MPSATTTLAYTTAAVGVLTLAMLYYLNRRRRKQHKNEKNKNNLPPDPNAWNFLGTLQTINLYPFKSGAAIVLTQAHIDKQGLSWLDIRDRCLVLLDDAGDVIYAGKYPRMLSVRTKLVPTGAVFLLAPELRPLHLDLAALRRNGKRVPQAALKTPFPLPLLMGEPAHHTWCSRAVLKRDSGVRLCLVLYDKSGGSGVGVGNSVRGSGIANWLFRRKAEQIIPIMALHDKSLKDLNYRLSAANRVNSQQFRGNLIIESKNNVPSYDEDRWQWLKIGDDPNNCTILRYKSECLRCILINVNVDTCTRNAAGEPLRTLKRYRLRQSPKDPSMGLYFDVYSEGVGLLNRGDAVYVQYI